MRTKFLLCLVIGLLASSSFVAAAAGDVSAPIGSSPVAARLASKVPTPRPADVDAELADATASSAQAMNDFLIEVINAIPNNTWTAGKNDYFEGKSFEFLAQSCGTKLDMPAVSADGTPFTVGTAPAVQSMPLGAAAAPAAAYYPEFYDARQRWGASCPSLYDIRDQAGCGSCWAVAAASVMTDRTCIASGGARQPYLSSRNILSCCGAQCGSCGGGYPIHAFQMWQTQGVVTGGGFGSYGTCQPYFLAPCNHYVQDGLRPKCEAHTSTPSCNQACDGGALNYHSDKTYGSSAYQLSSNEDAIKNEIMTKGPVEAGFMVYADFPHYRSGVYRHVTGQQVGGHAIKILGWGVENGQKYWLAANSWNRNWGDQGYFKIARGVNECGIESMMWAGDARV